MKSLVTPVALVLLAAPLSAQEKPSAEQRIAELEKKVELLAKGEDPNDTGKVKLANQAEVARRGTRAGLRSFFDEGYWVLGQSHDGAFKLWMDNRVNLDAAWYNGSKNRLADGVAARRMRLGFKATMYRDWLAEVDIDLADNEASIKDMWIGYAGFKDSVIRIGNHKQPFGLDTISSSKNIWLMERSYTDSWTPDRRPGVSYATWGKRWQAAVGLFSQEINKEATGVDQGWGMAGRVTFAPVFVSENKVVHLGLGATHRKPDAGVGSGSTLPPIDYTVTFDTRPETKVARTKFLAAKLANVETFNQTGLEFAGVWGPFSWQSEYQQTKVQRRSGFPTLADHTFKAYYGQVSWFLTGGQRNYSASEAEFDRVVPTGKHGAWELIARWSTMDLNDVTTLDPVRGGSAKNLTVGLTWHINTNFKWMLNVTKVDHDDYAKPTKATFGTATNDDFTFVSTRFAVHF